MITELLSASGDQPQEPATLLRELDQMLAQRAAAIEVELREISGVRKRIESLLPPAVPNPVRTSSLPCAPGASLGQMI